jgi:hypothetical protein
MPHEELSIIDEQQKLGTNVQTDLLGVFEVPATAGAWRITWSRVVGRQRISTVVQRRDGSTEESEQDAKRMVGERLGVLTCDPQAAVPTGMDAKGKSDPRLSFRDQRLAPLQVVIGTVAAVLGIVALAAGIAGYFRGVLVWPMRLLAFAAAALLLYPGEGFRLGDLRVGYTDLAGLAVIVGIVLLGGRRPSDSRPAANRQPAGLTPDRVTRADEQDTADESSV